MSLRVEINEDDYRRVIKAIKPLERSEESVLKTAVNNAAKKAQKNLISSASKRYVGEEAKRATIKGQSAIKKADVSGVTSIVEFASPMKEIGGFHVSSMEVRKPEYTKKGKRRKIRLKGKVLRGASKGLGAAFVVQFKSGHIAVVKRIDGKNMDQYANKPKIPHYAKLEKLLSPNVAEMLGNKNVYKPDEIAALLHEEVEKVLGKVLGG